MSDLPEVTEVQRLALRPGDRLILRVPVPLNQADAERLRERLRECFPEAAEAIVLDQGMSLEVAGPP